MVPGGHDPPTFKGTDRLARGSKRTCDRRRGTRNNRADILFKLSGEKQVVAPLFVYQRATVLAPRQHVADHRQFGYLDFDSIGDVLGLCAGIGDAHGN